MYVFSVLIFRQRGGAYVVPPLYSSGPNIPDNRDDETKDRLWEAMKTALGIFEGIPGNICTTCQERFAWAGTTACVRCSVGGREIPDADRVSWGDRVIPRPREII